MNAGRIEILAGDLDRAATVLGEGCEQLEALGETAFLSTTATYVALVEIRRGERHAAERWLDVAERTASPGDRASQLGIRVVRGLLLIADGDRAGDDHLRAGLELADETDALLWRADIRLDAAAALPPERRDDVARLAREALELAEAKQIPVLIAEARRILADVEHTNA
jgi:hypothetical protein